MQEEQEFKVILGLQSEFKASLGYGRLCLSSNRQIKEPWYKGCL